MNRKTTPRSRQQSLVLDPDDARRKLSAAAREECRLLLMQMLIHIVQLERRRENGDE